MTLDLAGVSTKQALHDLFKDQLGFPEWYGANWDAFWDCIIAIVNMPEQLVLLNWQLFAQACPKDMSILQQIVQDYAHEKPSKQIVLA